MKIKVYGTSSCGYCNMTQQWLTENHIPYEYINLDDDKKKQSFYQEYAFKTVPQIFIDSEHIGGYNQMMSMRLRILSENKIIFDEKF